MEGGEGGWRARGPLAPADGTGGGEAEADESVMARLAAGDDRALNELMARWEVSVKRFVLRLGVPGAEVEDVAQEAFVRLYRSRGRYREGAAFRPWLLTIAGNLARNRLRWRRRHPTEELGAWEAVAPGGVPGEALDVAERVAEVRAAVVGLPSRLREVVTCVEFEGLTQAEAAQVLGCTVKAVETRLYRARAALREALGGEAGR